MSSTNGRAVFKVGVGGPVGSGKTALIEALVPRAIAEGFSPVVVTNDIYTQLDAEHVRAALHGILPADRIVGVETGSCPHTAVRDDPTANIAAMEELLARFPDADLLFLESGGDNLTLTFSPTLVDAYIFVIDVAEGDDIPRKKGPGITHSDLLVINKVDLAPYVRVDLDVMRSGAERARPDGAPWVMTNSLTGEGLDQVLDFIATTSKAGRSDNVRQLLEALPPHSHGHGHGHPHTHHMSAAEKERLLPARYRDGAVISSAPMGAADLVYDQEGQVAWDQIWGDFCDLAWAGGPPHRGTVLRKGNEAEIREHAQAYEGVIDELSRGLVMVTGWPVWKNCPAGNIGLVCPDQNAARWLCSAITAENIEVTIFNDRILLLPAGPDFRVQFEIKNVITAVAKTHHYWTEHRSETEHF